MKRSDALMKIVALLLFCAMVCYLGLNLYRRLSDPVKTALAVSATVTDAASMSGLAVRSEQVVEREEPYIEITASEGEKIAHGGSVATVYSSAGALDRALSLRALGREIAQAQAALSAKDAAGAAGRDEVVYAALTALSADVQAGDFSDADTRRSVLEGLIFEKSADISQERLTQLQSQYDELAAASAGETVAVTVAAGGVFSPVVDGFESLTPDQAAALTPEVLRALAAEDRTPSAKAVGKIVTEFRWYYAAVMNAQDAARLTEDDYVSLSFGRYCAQLLSARVESVGQPENGECTVLFSMDRGLIETLAVRSVSAELIFEEDTGLRVPTEGLWRYWAGWLDAADAALLSPGDPVTMSLDGQVLNCFVSELGAADGDTGQRLGVFCWAWSLLPAPDSAADAVLALADGRRVTARTYFPNGGEPLCVFTMTGLQAERKKITLVCAGTEFCLVNSVGEDALREGNDIILSAGGLYAGKVFD